MIKIQLIALDEKGKVIIAKFIEAKNLSDALTKKNRLFKEKYVKEVHMKVIRTLKGGKK
jgi:hypothetical protein